MEIMRERMSGTMQPKALSIDASMLERSFDPSVAKKGTQYVKERRVDGCTFDDESIQGEVRRAAPCPCPVKVWVEDGEVRSECGCCPESDNCEHGYALCLHWMKNRDTCLDLMELKEAWDRAGKDELIEALLRAVEMHPEILGKVAVDSLLRAGGPSAGKFALGRVREILDGIDPWSAGQASDGIEVVLSSLRERREEIGDEAAADAALSIYGEVAGKIGRPFDPERILAETASEAATLFRDLCLALDPPSRDRFRDRALEMFFRGGEEAGGYLVLLSVVTPSNAGAMVAELDRRVAGAIGRRGPSYAVTSEEAQRAAAEVLAEAGKVEEAVSRLTVSGDIGDVFRAVGLLTDAGQEGRAVELMMSRRPTGSPDRGAWETLALMALRELQEQGKLHLVSGEAVEAVAVSVMRCGGPHSGGGAAAARKLLEAVGGPGSFERAVLSIRDRRKRAWAFVEAGDAARAREAYAALGKGGPDLAWAIAEIADRGGLADLRDEMTAEALAQGGVKEMFGPRYWPRAKKALEDLDIERLAAFAEKDRLPSERRAEVMKMLVGREPGLAAKALDRLVPHLSRGELFALLG